MQVNADLHIHSRFSIGTSRTMDLPGLFSASRQKGLQVLGSGDALHPEWREMCRKFEGRDDIVLVPTTEVEDRNRIHHLVLMEDFDACEALATTLSSWSRNIRTSGRPHVSITGETLAREVHQLGGRIGPAHAFTPWTSLFARFDHLRDCYGDEMVDFLELGLSADTTYASGIPDLATVPFLSNSDAHSADPVKVGREWNRIEIPDLSVSAVLESVTRGRIVYNAGFFPEVGKYNRTACSRCYYQYSRNEAETLRWRCSEDGGRIKKGVWDRARELSTSPPTLRPPYHRCVALGEILRQVLGTSSSRTRKCQVLYRNLLMIFGDEITVLMDTPIAEIQSIHEGVAQYIQALRTGEIEIGPGGGGRYGTISLKSKHYGMYPTTDHNA